MTSMPPGVSRTLEMPPVCPRNVMRCKPPACSREGVRVKRQGDAAAWRPASSLPPSSLTSHSCAPRESLSMLDPALGTCETLLFVHKIACNT